MTKDNIAFDWFCTQRGGGFDGYGGGRRWQTGSGQAIGDL
jgi:hypothetical protein